MGSVCVTLAYPRRRSVWWKAMRFLRTVVCMEALGFLRGYSAAWLASNIMFQTLQEKVPMRDSKWVWNRGLLGLLSYRVRKLFVMNMQGCSKVRKGSFSNEPYRRLSFLLKKVLTNLRMLLSQHVIESYLIDNSVYLVQKGFKFSRTPLGFLYRSLFSL